MGVASTRNSARKQPGELAQVELGDEHAVVAREHLAEVRREGVEVHELGAGDVAGRSGASRATAASIAPSVEPQPTTSVVRRPARVVDHDVGDGRCDPRDAVVTQARHRARGSPRRRRPSPGPSDFSSPPMRCSRPGQPRRRPGARERRLVAHVGPERLGAVGVGVVGRRGERGVDRGERVDVGDAPGLRAVREVRVREQDHRRAVGDRDADRLERRVEAVARRLRRHDRQRGLAVAPVHREQEVGLLDLRGQTRRGPAALDVDDEQRQLEADREADRLALEVDARAARGRHAERAAVARPDRRGDRRDLVLGLERADAELLALGELVEDVRGRRDRVAAQEQRQARHFCAAVMRPHDSAVLPVTFAYSPGAKGAAWTS